MEAQLQSLLAHCAMWKGGGVAFSNKSPYSRYPDTGQERVEQSLRPCRDSKLNYSVNQHVV
jgi:hypothetical protein